ncbi:unnamed protein product [Danaus chrysippus]|uniref:(African queen) hypothetical protein n=1 Tax=Danaus chrysippus TaxID=151541 RepID=A0A8J2QW37_9NEOP|nr:unnamed protein product [Danaus chrysippus]
MKYIFLTVAGFAVIVESQLLFGLGRLGAELGSRIGSALGHSIDAVADIGNGAIDAGVGVGELNHGPNIAYNRGNDGSRLYSFGSKGDANNYHETDSGSNEYDAGVSSTERSESYRRHQQHYHKHRRHHTKITKIESSSSSDEQDIDDSRKYETGALKSNGYHSQDRGARDYSKHIYNAAQRV